MALQADDFISPKGILEPGLFPAKTAAQSRAILLERVEAYILQGNEVLQSVAPAGFDNAMRAYVNYRTFEAVLQLMRRNPTQTTLDGGNKSLTFTAQQIKDTERERDRWERTYLDFIPDVPGADNPVARSRSSRMKVRI